MLATLVFGLFFSVLCWSQSVPYEVTYIIKNKTQFKIYLDEEISNGDLNYYNNHVVEPNGELELKQTKLKHRNDYRFETGYFHFDGELKPNINHKDYWVRTEVSRSQAEVVFTITDYIPGPVPMPDLEEPEMVVEKNDPYYEFDLDEPIRPLMGVDSLFSTIQSKFEQYIIDQDIKIYVRLEIDPSGEVKDIVVLKSNRKDIHDKMESYLKTVKWNEPKKSGRSVSAYVNFPFKVRTD